MSKRLERSCHAYERRNNGAEVQFMHKAQLTSCNPVTTIGAADNHGWYD